MIIVSPYARALRSGEKNHPKNYPYWDKLIPMLKELDDVIQVGSGAEEALEGITDFRKNLPLHKLAELVDECVTWVSVDSFFQHFCWDLKKKGVVLWGQSDPLIFGHPENLNLLASRKFLREKQFFMWEQCEYKPEVFVGPDAVISGVKSISNTWITR